MRKRIVLWSVLIVLLIISLPGIFERWESETANRTYEIAVPIEEIDELATNESLTLDESIRSLKEAGLTTISLSPLNLYDMEGRGIITIYTETDLADALRFIDDESFDPNRKGYYITKPELDHYNEILLDALHPEEVLIAGEPFYFIHEDTGFGLSTSIGYDTKAMKQIEKHDLQLILRLNNDTSQLANHVNSHMIDASITNKNDRTTNLLFIGDEIIGYPDTNQMNDLTNQLHDVRYRFYTVEFTNQLGLDTVAKNTDYNVIRLHSIHLENKTLNQNIEQAVRAVKERNIRTIFFHIQTTDNPIDNLDNASRFIEGVYDKIPASFQPGNPEPFKPIDLSTWGIMVVLAAGILFTYLASGTFSNKYIPLIAASSMLALALFYLLSDRLFLLQAFGLIIAVITPIFAVLSTSRSSANKISNITFQYLKAILISFIGILIVIGLLNGNAFITGFELFRGVKLVYILPLLFVSIFLFYKEGLNLVRKHGISILQAKVKYWHLLILLVIAAFGLYYMSRTGNAGSVSEIELMIRSTLEDVLYVRPRTKEFLIGFPFFILALYIMNKHSNFGKLLLIPATIGFLSMMNTFTHFHIPLHLSLLRTLYSIIFGYIIGLLFIYLYKLVAPAIIKVFKGRLS